MPAIDSRILNVLACPQCNGGLNYEMNEPSLSCPKCQLVYPIRDGIPVLMVKEARKQ